MERERDIERQRETQREREGKKRKNVTLLICCTFSDIIDKPELVNLPLPNTQQIAVSENTPLGTSLFTVTYVDLDTDETNSIQVTFDPTWAWNYFHLNETSQFF